MHYSKQAYAKLAALAILFSAASATSSPASGSGAFSVGDSGSTTTAEQTVTTTTANQDNPQYPGASATSIGADPADLVPATPASSEQLTTHSMPSVGYWAGRPTTKSGDLYNIVGRVKPSLAGKTILLQLKVAGKPWKTLKTSTVGQGHTNPGRFKLSWTPKTSSYARIRVILKKDFEFPSRSPKYPLVKLPISSESLATWYGPGFYGNLTACGQRFSSKTSGVAHRTLPCGTQVEFITSSGPVISTVIDRGPYANDADFDFTRDVADKVGVEGPTSVQYIVRTDLPRVR